jgi:hypothetical protein
METPNHHVVSTPHNTAVSVFKVVSNCSEVPKKSLQITSVEHQTSFVRPPSPAGRLYVRITHGRLKAYVKEEGEQMGLRRYDTT